MPRKKPLLSDLVRDSRIETVFLDSCVQHVFHEAGRSANSRRVRREERWVRQEPILGRGRYGEVYLEKCQDGGIELSRAIKIVKKFVVVGEELDYARELEAIMKFSHPKYQHCFVTSGGWFERGDSVYITMEYMELGDLERHLTKPLPEFEARQITEQILEGLNFMHENGFIHRDLKPANIMVVTKTPAWFVKIADFGISKRRQHDVTTMFTSQRGTLGFAAPEAIDENSTYTFSVDMWSLGAVAYKILTSCMPFPTLKGLFQYENGKIPFPQDALKAKAVTEEGQDFITKLMQACPESRPTAKLAISHPWMTITLERPVKETDNFSTSTAVVPRVANPETDISEASKTWSSRRTTVIFAAQISQPTTTSNYQRPTVEDCSDESEGVKGSKLPLPTPVIPDPAPESTKEPPPCRDPTPAQDTSEEGTIVVRPTSPECSTTHDEAYDSDIDSSRSLSYDSSDEVWQEPEEEDDEEEGDDNDGFGDEEGEGAKPPSEPDEETLRHNQVVEQVTIAFLSGTGPQTTIPLNAGQNPRGYEDEFDHSYEWESYELARDYEVVTPNNLPIEGTQTRIACSQCGSAHMYPTGPLERLKCLHFICHNCLLRMIVFSLLSPQHMPPRCCMSENGEITNFIFRKLDINPRVIKTWKELWRLKTLRDWTCFRGHIAWDESLSLMFTQLPLWNQFPSCHGCYIASNKPNMSCFRARFCLFCSNPVLSGECTKCNHHTVIWDFILKVQRAGILNSSLSFFKIWQDSRLWENRPPPSPKPRQATPNIRRSLSSRFSRRNKIDPNIHPLNLPPEERKRFSGLATSGTSAPPPQNEPYSSSESDYYHEDDEDGVEDNESSDDYTRSPYVAYVEDADPSEVSDVENDVISRTPTPNPRTAPQQPFQQRHVHFGNPGTRSSNQEEIYVNGVRVTGPGNYDGVQVRRNNKRVVLGRQNELDRHAHMNGETEESAVLSGMGSERVARWVNGLHPFFNRVMPRPLGEEDS